MVKSNFRGAVNALTPSSATSHPGAWSQRLSMTVHRTFFFEPRPPAAQKGELTYILAITRVPWGAQADDAPIVFLAGASSTRLLLKAEVQPHSPGTALQRLLWCSGGRPDMHLLVLPVNCSSAALPRAGQLWAGRREVQEVSGDGVTPAG